MRRVRSVRYGHRSVRGLIESETSEHPHGVLIRLDGRRLCDCVGFHYRNRCSHIDRLIEELPSHSAREAFRESLERDPDKNMSSTELTIRTTLQPFNEMIDPLGRNDGKFSGIPVSTGIGLAGRPEAGKTTFSFQMAHEVMRHRGEGSNALMFDTEGSSHTYHMWQETFQQRFGLDTETVEVDVNYSNGQIHGLDYTKDPEVDHHIFILDVRDLTKILALHGRPANIGTEDGKMKLEPNGDFPDDIQDTPIGQFVSQESIDYLVYDSVTNPLETFTNRQQDRPTRAKATAWWMLQAQSLAEDRDLVQVFIVHLSKNPTNPYDRPDILGGKNIKHQIKYSVYMREMSEGERSMKLFRHPGKEPWNEEWFMKMESGKGFVDV